MPRAVSIHSPRRTARGRRTTPLAWPPVAVALTMIVLAGSFVTGHAPVAEAAPTEQFITAAGPFGPITVIGDSVLLGSLIYGPTLADQLERVGLGAGAHARR